MMMGQLSHDPSFQESVTALWLCESCICAGSREVTCSTPGYCYFSSSFPETTSLPCKNETAFPLFIVLYSLISSQVQPVVPPQYSINLGKFKMKRVIVTLKRFVKKLLMHL